MTEYKEFEIGNIISGLEDFETSIKDFNITQSVRNIVDKEYKKALDIVNSTSDRVEIESTLNTLNSMLSDFLFIIKSELDTDRDFIKEALNNISDIKLGLVNKEDKILIDGEANGKIIALRGKSGEYIKAVVGFMIVASTSQVYARVNSEDLHKLGTYESVGGNKNNVSIGYGTWQTKYVVPTVENLFDNKVFEGLFTEEEEGRIRLGGEDNIPGDFLSYNKVIKMKNYGYSEDFIQGR